jgi:hypothetical protein
VAFVAKNVVVVALVNIALVAEMNEVKKLSVAVALVNVAVTAERSDEKKLVAVALFVIKYVLLAFTAKKLVVEALVATKLVAVALVDEELVESIVSVVKLVLKRFVIVAIGEVSDVIVVVARVEVPFTVRSPDAERFVVEAFVRVVFPVTESVPVAIIFAALIFPVVILDVDALPSVV